ncbi:MAG: YjbF family lipoprotein [Alphaproteobacteria bacterium]|nr:YjbF family lipoprotein [Alphaproteobacteria bacterium]
MLIFLNRNIPKIFPIIFVFCAGVLLSACSKTNLNTPQSFFKNNKAQITRESISKLPYASLAAKIHSNTPSLIILGQILNDQLFWYSSEKEVLVTRYGRVVRSYGLEHNLWGLRDTLPLSNCGGRQISEFAMLKYEEYVPLAHLSSSYPHSEIVRVYQDDIFKAGLHTIKKPLQRTFELDLNRKAKQNLKAIATYSIVKPESIIIYEMNYDTLKISEKVHVKDINWHYENFYWVDPKTGFMWKSIQHLHPKLDPIEVNVLKRVAP